METFQFVAHPQKRSDTNHTPAWSTQVERWYQLDELGFSFCEALYEWNLLEKFKKPDLVILAIKGGSNLADRDFVSNGSQSPAKFVYTLPNISAAVIFQMLKIQGKVFCVSEGEQTFEVARNEAAAYAKTGNSVWLFETSSIDELKRLIEFKAY